MSKQYIENLKIKTASKLYLSSFDSKKKGHTKFSIKNKFPCFPCFYLLICITYKFVSATAFLLKSLCYLVCPAVPVLIKMSLGACPELLFFRNLHSVFYQCPVLKWLSYILVVLSSCPLVPVIMFLY
jgi:hypothetical protein